MHDICPLVTWKTLEIAVSEPHPLTMCLNFHESSRRKIFPTTVMQEDREATLHTDTNLQHGVVWSLSGGRNRADAAIFPHIHALLS